MRRRWFSPRALLLHLAVIVWVPGCIIAAWWQVDIALAGDHLGWLYSIEWPCFALFGVVVWWNLVHDDPETVGSRALRRTRPSDPAAAAPVLDAERLAAEEAEDPQLAAYNEYLQRLADGAPDHGWRR